MPSPANRSAIDERVAQRTAIADDRHIACRRERCGPCRAGSDGPAAAPDPVSAARHPVLDEQDTGRHRRCTSSASPTASAGVDGTTTFMPATCANQASSMSECCPAVPPPAPVRVRMVIGTRGLAARHEAQLGRVIDDLIHGDGDEVHQHDLRHRPHAGERRADRRADDGLLRRSVWCAPDARRTSSTAPWSP